MRVSIHFNRFDFENKSVKKPLPISDHRLKLCYYMNTKNSETDEIANF